MTSSKQFRCTVAPQAMGYANDRSTSAEGNGMTRDDALWIGAADLARTAMGTRIHGGGRNREVVREATYDPLAWWCLTQAIYDLAANPIAYVEGLNRLRAPQTHSPVPSGSSKRKG